MTLRIAADQASDRSGTDRLKVLGLDRQETMRIAQERALYLLKESGLLYDSKTLQMFTLASIDGIMIGYDAATRKEPHAQA